MLAVRPITRLHKEVNTIFSQEKPKPKPGVNLCIIGRDFWQKGPFDIAFLYSQVWLSEIECKILFEKQ